MEYRSKQYSVILTPSQGAQVIGHVAEFLDHLGVAEIARSKVTSAAERDRANVPLKV
jgi:hypothetical protein